MSEQAIEYGNEFLDIFAALEAPFGEGEVKTRQQAGRTFDYITARSVMNRLDSVVGPRNWFDEYVPAGEHSVLCKLTIRLPDGTLLTKCDAGGNAGMSDQGDDDKSGFSDAFKRAAVKHGVGRYLYRNGVPTFASALHPDGGLDSGQRSYSPPPQRQSGGYDRQQSPPPQRNHSQNGSSGNGGRGNFSGQPPRSGRALFAWAKDQGQKHDVDLVGYLQKWSKLQADFPDRLVDCDADQTARAYQEATRKLSGVGGGRDDAYEEALAN